MNLDFQLSLVKDQPALAALAVKLASLPCFAVDIETTDWWNPQRERVALIQVAYRTPARLAVSVVDAFAPLDLSVLTAPLEQTAVTKIMHNATFDATRLARHFQLAAAPIHDTLLAARRAGERRISLKMQAAQHLGVTLDKQLQRADWSVRPLPVRHLAYAAQDAAATLLLYEHQLKRRLTGEFRLRSAQRETQTGLPLADTKNKKTAQPVSLNATTTSAKNTGRYPSTSVADTKSSAPDKLTATASDYRTDTDLLTNSAVARAILGIIAQLPTRYSPDQLAVSLGAERIGIAGWTIDRILGDDVDLDETTVKQIVVELCERNLIQVTPTRRLIATGTGSELWQQLTQL